jgi:hypothetical protein
LAAHLGVEGRLVEDEERILIGADDVDELRVGVGVFVAEELGGG